MAKVNFIRDSNNEAVHALKLTGTSARIATSGVSSSVALPAGLSPGEVARIAATEHCYINFGTGAVTADTTSVLFPAGVEYIVVPAGVTHMAAIQVSGGGVVTIMEVS